MSSKIKKHYKTKNGRHLFTFEFCPNSSEVVIYCRQHPPLNGKDSDPHKTHLFRSGKLCFSSGKGPKSQSRAEELAAQWAEYYMEYSRTGQTQS